MRRVAIYSRIDGGKDPETAKRSVAFQQNSLREYARRLDMQVVVCYEDIGYSGNTNHRPGLRKLQSCLSTGELDAILVYSLRQIGRNEDAWMKDIDVFSFADGIYCNK